MSLKLINADCLDALADTSPFTCIFADPPDNIDLGYGEYKDRMPEHEYLALLAEWVELFTRKADVVWLSFNARWTVAMGAIVSQINHDGRFDVKPCVQAFTFGQHNSRDFGNNHRPLWRFQKPKQPVYAESIRVPSARQRVYKDSRANSKGRVPGDVFDMQYGDVLELVEFLGEVPAPGDVFDFPRVTGTSKQRCDWHPTQLHEDLVERCLRSSTQEGDTVCDPFGGTGTTLRVCEKIGRDCTVIEVDGKYCRRIAEANGLVEDGPGRWSKPLVIPAGAA